MNNNAYYEDDGQSPNFKPERDPDYVRDSRIDAELQRAFDDIESGTKLEILEKLVGDKSEN